MLGLLHLYASPLEDFSVLVIQKKEEGESPFGMEDLSYYVKRIKDQQFHINFGVIRQYFPINLVLSGIFKICQDLFGNHSELHLVLSLILLS